MIEYAVSCIAKIIGFDKVFLFFPELRHDDEQAAGFEQVTELLHFIMRIKEMFETFGGKDEIMGAGREFRAEKGIVILTAKALALHQNTEGWARAAAVIQSRITGF